MNLECACVHSDIDSLICKRNIDTAWVCWPESSNISFTVCIRSAPEPGGPSSAAEAGGTGNQCETCGGHEASGGPRPEAEGFGGGGQAQVLGLGGACPDTTRVRLLNMTLFVMFISCYDDFHEYKYQSPFISQS